MAAFKNILVPIDFGDASDRARQVATEIADKFGARITLAHFWEVPAYPYLGSLYASWDFVTPVGQAAEQQIANTLAEVRTRIPQAESICRMGSPWQEILRAIDEVHADLVVMGTHGRRGIARALLGSVAEKLVRTSPVPVLTVSTVEATSHDERADVVG